ncbi:DUF1521 domain-containing protein [Sphingomonas xinjiangensis]|uniref:DUF1521 domain-containing protein n=1 Tax=Sphingomonas xinjiangensis TaxID=643568 RepID=A0A840YFZ0_9SPHN|nr:DUF1521 domain-containing protein [Sphingomonas xinjiangensis]MBB5710889.1 hypothetical protein [Sphingomonas xinjiangensis]
MTTISNGQSAQFATSANLVANGNALMFAAGIMAQSFQPFNAGPLAFSMLPAMFAVRLGTLAQGAAPSQLQQQAGYTAHTTGQHTANVGLGDGYKLEIDERSSQMRILNENTGQRTRVWGDPHVEVDGKHQFDFYGTTTFELDNGTKITINTEQGRGNPNVYYASQVVVTKGENAVIIDGISEQQLGDLSVSVSANGYALDAANRDGFTVHEDAAGWQTELGAKVTQAEADITRPGQLYGPGSDAPSLAELGTAIGHFLFFGSLFSGSADASVRPQALAPDSSKLLRQLLVA